MWRSHCQTPDGGDSPGHWGVAGGVGLFKDRERGQKLHAVSDAEAL
jgi:hypothetical protein